MDSLLPPDSSAFPDIPDSSAGHSTGEVILSPAPESTPSTALAVIPEPQRVEPEEPPRRRGRLFRRFLLLLVALGATAWFAPTIVAKTPLRNFVLARLLGKYVNGSVTAGGMSAGWKSPIVLRDVRIISADGEVIGTVPVATTSRTLLELIRDQDHLGTITVERLQVTLTTSPGTSNVEDFIRPILVRESTGGDRPELVVIVADGQLTVKDAGTSGGETLDAVNVTVTVPKPAAEPVHVEVAANAAGGAGHLETDLTVGTVVAGKLKANGVPLSVVGPVVRRYAPGTELAGTLTADVNGNSSLGEDGTLNGLLTVSGLDVAGPWLGTDRLKLAKVELPCQIDITNGMVEVEQAELNCDVGSLSVVGRYDPKEPSERILLRPGLRSTLNVDLAKLSKLLPGVLRIRDGTDLHAGRVKLSVSSDPVNGSEIGWMARLETTALRGTRNGQPIAWDSPFWAEGSWRSRTDGLPEFDKLECQSDFFALAARGGPDKFVGRANLNLDKLTARLGEFVDLRGVTLSGAATVTLDGQRDPATGSGTAHGSANFTKFVVRDSGRIGIDESDLTVDFRLAGIVTPNGPYQLSEATAEVKAAQDQDRLGVVLLAPIPDVRTANAGSASLRLNGDMGRWRNRLGWLGLPPTVKVAGTGTVSGQLDVTPATAKVTKALADVANFQFQGYGLNLDERAAKLEGVAEYDRKTEAVAITGVRLSSQTLGATAGRIDLTRTPEQLYRAKGTATVTANVNRVQRSIGLDPNPDSPSSVHGLANGDVQFDVILGGGIVFDIAGKVDQFRFGTQQNPTWQEPWVKLASAGRWDPRADTVTFTTMRLERDGLSTEAKGTAARMGGPTPVLNFEGMLNYDLAKLEPQLREVLGSGATATGKASKPFKLAGSLAEGAAHLTVAVDGVKSGGRFFPGATPDPTPTPTAPRPPTGNPGSTKPMQITFDNLTGSAGLGWEMVKAYGFEVGPGEFTGELKNGTVNFSPISAKFGVGDVRVSSSMKLTPNLYPLTIAPGRIVEKAKLTPEACANALGFALPPLANAAKVDGLVSLDLSEGMIPLVNPNQAAVKGTLTIHTATVSAGPMLAELTSALGGTNSPLTIATEQKVPIRVENGRVYHENLILQIEKTAVKSSGSVGLDGTMTVLMEVQFPPRLAQQLVPNNPRIREALLKQTIRVPLGGTLQKPKVDAKGMQIALQKMIADATREATGGFLGDLLDKATKKK